MSIEKLIAELNSAIAKQTAATEELTAVLTAAASEEPAAKPAPKKKAATKKKVAKKPEPEPEPEIEDDAEDLIEEDEEEEEDLLGLDDEDEDDEEVTMELLTGAAKDLLNASKDVNGNRKKLVALMEKVGVKKVKDATEPDQMVKLYRLIKKALK